MIVHCEKCQTKFDFNEERLKKEGSRVRCSVCKHVFTVYPQKQTSPENIELEPKALDEFEKTVSLDLKRMLEEDSGELGAEDRDLRFDEHAVRYRNDRAELRESAKSVLDNLMSGPAIDEIEEITPEDWGGDISGREGFDTISRKRPTKSALPRILLILLLLIIGAGVATYFLMPEIIPDSLKIFGTSGKSKPGDAGIKALSFEDVSGFFVQSEIAGRLFIIKGMIKNDYPEGRRDVLIKAAILNDKGKEVKVAKVYAGKSLKEDQIKAMNQAAIKKAMSARSKSIVRPGKTVPFTVILDGLPDNMSEFTVEPVQSSPAK